MYCKNKWEIKDPPQAHKCTLQCSVKPHIQQKSKPKKIISDFDVENPRHSKHVNFKKTMLGIRKYGEKR